MPKCCHTYIIANPRKLTTPIEHSGLTGKDIELWKERRKLDKECSVEQEVDMLRNCKFNVVKCVYSYQKFSVIVAIK